MATDFSPGSNVAVERAVQMAAVHGTSLHLLHAFDVSAWNSLKAVFDAQHMTMDPPPDVRTRQRLVETASALAVQTGLRVEPGFGLGKAETAIASFVADHPDALVVIGSRADPDLFGLGSTAAKVLRSPAAPVLVVRSARALPYKNLMEATELRNSSVRAARLAMTLFPAAHHHLFLAVDPALDRALWSGSLAKAQMSLLHDSIHGQACRELQQLAHELAPLALHPVNSEVSDDVPSRALIVRAAALPADCIVVGHHGEDAAERRFLGNTDTGPMLGSPWRRAGTEWPRGARPGGGVP